jgi:hypothetical protein
MVFRQVLELVIVVIALLHFWCSDSVCDLRFKPDFSFILLVLFLSSFFFVVLLYNEIKNNFFHFLLDLRIELLHQ